MDFDAACQYLESLAPRGWRLGLDRMHELCRRAGLADALDGKSGPRYLHVAGTNGKGSVTALLQSVLGSAGYQAGAYFSPFVYDIRERVQVRGELISQEAFARHVEALRPHADSLSDTEFGGATEFEVKTAMGFRHWREAQCEWVALEVGLGGRLDATNVVTPAASSVVSIGMDHMHLLGDTHAKIAYEKAGVVKPGIPVVLGEMPAEALATIEAVALERNAPVWRVGREVVLEAQGGDEWRVCTPAGTLDGLKPGLQGFMAPHNMAVALAMLQAASIGVPDDAARDGVARARLQGRFEEVCWNGRKVLLDGAHNADSGLVLARTLQLRRAGCRVHLVLGMTKGHDPGEFFAPLKPFVDAVHVAPLAFHRAQGVEEIAAALPGVQTATYATVLEALVAADLGAPNDAVVLVTGSFYLVGEAGRLMGIGAPTPDTDSPRCSRG